MLEQIEQWLHSVSLKNSTRRVLTMAQEKFGGELTSNHRYLKINGVEYSIFKDMDVVAWKVRVMTWEHGNDFRFAKPY